MFILLQIQNLVSENNKLQHNINKLISRMAELEQDKNRMMSQLEKNNRYHRILHQTLIIFANMND